MENISNLFNNVKQLPVLPILLLELMDSFSNEQMSSDDLAIKIGMDQSISAKVIKMANSATYSRGKQVDSISQAVVRLGFNQIRSIVIAASLSNTFPDTPNFDRIQFWKDTFTTASIAKALAKHTDVNPETAFTCAMMHNIGELLLQILKPNECSLMNMAMESGEPHLTAQREVFGFDYTQVGIELAKHWKFSQVFCDAIEQQLDPLSYNPPSQPAILIRLSVFAGFAWKAKLPAKMIIARFPKQLLNHLDLNADYFSEELSQIIIKGQELGSLIAN
ncbi:MAG: HDOD domain-containing protein [Psychromonas sp.]|nr:HDOD domain-containing protein [Psychromonas sp.]